MASKRLRQNHSECLTTAWCVRLVYVRPFAQGIRTDLYADKSARRDRLRLERYVRPERPKSRQFVVHLITESAMRPRRRGLTRSVLTTSLTVAGHRFVIEFHL